MQLHFNELSSSTQFANKYMSNDKMILFVQALAHARKLGFLNIRSSCGAHEINLAENYSVYNWLFDREFPEVHRNLLLGMIVQPFIEEGQQELEDRYLNATYSFEDAECNIEKQECFGLAAAYLYEMPTISIPSLPIWERTKLDLIIESKNETEIEPIFNIAKIESFEDLEVKSYLETLGDINLTTTNENPENKSCHLSDHHGKKELAEFWDKIRNSPYVIEARSTNWGGKRFIRKVLKTGDIEIVLTNTSRHYALLVTTTGKNYRETKEIAAILEKEYA